jgi:hypothetical protein
MGLRLASNQPQGTKLLPTTVDPDDIDETLEQRHRDAMLDVVLAWATVDGALGMLLSGVRGLSLYEGAAAVGAMPASAILAEVHRAIRTAQTHADASDQAGFDRVASTLKRYKKKYEEFSVVRNRIAHSYCKGIWTVDRNFVVFMIFKQHGSSDLAAECISIENMELATKFGNHLCAAMLRFASLYFPT